MLLTKISAGTLKDTISLKKIRNLLRNLSDGNTIENGIQRVDACRTQDGELLLVELEDLNHYLSILEVDEQTREKFMNDLVSALTQCIY